MKLFDVFFLLFEKFYEVQRVYRRFGHMQIAFFSMWLIFTLLILAITLLFSYIIDSEHYIEFSWKSIGFIILGTGLFNVLFYYNKKDKLLALESKAFVKSEDNWRFMIFSTVIFLCLLTFCFKMLNIF